MLGALPPEGMEWQAGKTAASIAFVNEVTAMLNKGMPWREATEIKIQKLVGILMDVKAGRKVFTELVNMKEFVKTL